MVVHVHPVGDLGEAEGLPTGLGIGTLGRLPYPLGEECEGRGRQRTQDAHPQGTPDQVTAAEAGLNQVPEGGLDGGIDRDVLR
jgi:hypothetical protein